MWVSVPLRGNGYRKLQRVIVVLEVVHVSVPLRGNGYRKFHSFSGAC